MVREYVKWDLTVMAESHGPEDDEAIQDIISEHSCQLTAALHGRQPMVSCNGTVRAPPATDRR
jgi:hypothetical protein